MNKLDYSIFRTSLAFTVFTLISIFCGSCHASDKPQIGNQYKIVGPVYLSGIYLNLNNRQLNRQLASGQVSAVQYSGPEVAFQRIVPVGTIMTIIGIAPKRLPLPFYANRYFVRLEPTGMSIELDLILELDLGIEGSLDGLNPELFSRPAAKLP